ncbi:MAG: hypothetical protein EU540_03355 [Promethearchaeota archaeon]|nr:MAG: hypothetical protein EU540_03355 [Candidatus Lokiarchaeota archaeon]
MSEETKQFFINVKDLSFRSDNFVVDLIRYLSEALPQIKIMRDVNELEIEAPLNLSKRIIRLRIRKYLYKKKLDGDYRPISYIDPEKDGYIIKEKKLAEITYY